MGDTWLAIIDFAWIALFFVIATVLKSRIEFFKNYIVPTSIIAGFIGLILGPELFNLARFDSERLGSMVYHLMAVGFIAISLKDRGKKKNKDTFNSGIYIVSIYLIQGIIGFGITLLLAYTIYPDLFAPLGLLLPLGFGQGPGQAFSIGSQWEELGLVGGGNLGLSIAAIGFLWATIVGVIVSNYFIKRGDIVVEDSDKKGERAVIVEEISPDEIPLSDAHDKLSFQIAIIGVIYLITYATIYAAASYLNTLGTFGETFAHLLWGFHFLIGSLYAILFKIIFNKLRNKGFAFYNAPNNYLLQRVAGAAFDFMIAASIAAISFYSLKSYWVTILLLTTFGGIATIFHTYYVAKWIYRSDKLENFLGFFGMGTGTISTGMALLRAVDPKFRTNVPENLVMGSAVAAAFGLPLMLILNIPIVGVVSDKPIMYLYTMLLLIGYLALMYILLYLNVRRTNK